MKVDIASNGGNFLLNVGPNEEGIIPEPSAQRLREMGQWLKVNGEAVYGTTASPFGQPFESGRVTQKPGKLYLHVFEWPKDGKLLLPRLEQAVGQATLLADGSRLGMRPAGADTEISLPAQAPDKLSSTIVVDLR